MDRRRQDYRTVKGRADFISVAVLATAAVLASAATTGAVFALFHSASSTPWLPAEQASLVAQCDARSSAKQRRACVQEVADRRVALRFAVR